MSFQSALEALNSTSHRDASTNPILNSVVEPLRESLSTYPWLLPKEALPFLLSAGIPNSGLGTTPHPHPVHKTIETFMLYNHWSCLARTPSTVMFMKPSKFQKLQAFNDNFSHLLNFRLSAADTARYPSTSLHLPTTPCVFIHDALMYFTPSQILDLFTQCPSLETLYCSLIVPPESNFTDLSLYPNLYTYHINQQTLHYIPEGHNAGAYNQPLQALSWLKLSAILGSHLSLSVTKLESWGPVHSLLIQRGLPPNHPSRSPFLPARSNQPSPLSRRSNQAQLLADTAASLFPAPTQQAQFSTFKVPDCLELPQATFLHQPLRHRLVPTAVYNALFTYTRAVRTLRTSDPAGFVRTQSNKPEYSWVTPNAWDNLQTFALLNAAHRPAVSYHFFASPFKRLLLKLQQHWRTYALSAAPFLAACLLTPLASNIRLPFYLPYLQSLFRRQIHPSSTLDLSLHVPLAGTRRLSLPIHPHLQHMNVFLRKHFPHLLPNLPLLPVLKYHRPLLLSLIPRPFVTLPVLSSLCFLPNLLFFIFHPPTPQQMHDRYHQQLHPAPFHLSWSLLDLRVPTTHPFLPLLLPPPQSPTAPSAPSPPTPVFRLCPTPPQSSTEEPELSPDSLSSTPNSPTVQMTKNSPDPPSVHPPPHSDEPSPILDSTVLPSGALSYSSPAVQSPPPQSPARPQDGFISLDLDPTAIGGSLPFSELFPADHFPDSALFLTRARHVPPTNLPMPKLNCLLTAFSSLTNIPLETVWLTLQSKLPDSLLSSSEIATLGFSTDILSALCFFFHYCCSLHTPFGVHNYGIFSSSNHISLFYQPGPPAHFSSTPRLTASYPRSNPSSEPLVRAALRFKVSGSFLPFTQAHLHPASLTHAKNLISNMKNGFDGILSSISSTSRSGPSPRERIFTLDSLIDVSPSRSIPVIHISGFAGCGKTHPIQKLLQSKAFHDFRVSTPTNELRSEWKRDMAPTDENVWRFSTWESSLLKHSSVLVIDEIYKLPRGYLDLSILADPTLRLVFILGDPLQGEYHSTSSHSSNHHLPSEISRLRHYIDCYCWWTYRLPSFIAGLFGVDTFSTKEGFVSTVPTHPPQSKNLVNAMNTAASLQQMGHHAITISSSQGITFDEPHTILLDRHTNLLSTNNCLVALTRSRVGIHFIGNLHLASADFGTNYMFSRALAGQYIDMASCFPSIYPHLPKMYHPISTRTTRLVAGYHSIPLRFVHQPVPTVLIHSHKSKLSLPPHVPVDWSGDFCLTNPVVLGSILPDRLPTSHLPPTRLPLHFDLPSSTPSSSSSSSLSSLFPTPISLGLFGETFENLAAFFLPAHDPELREVHHRDQSSSQFPFFDRPFHLSCQPSSLLAPVHSPSSDPTLLPFSIKKRLRFRLSEAPYKFTANDSLLGHHLFSSLCKAYNRSPHSIIPFDPHLFAECININEYAQLSSKTQATIVANAARSDPDWRHTSVRIFAKSQHKVNDGSLFSNWKACQTLALMHDFVILTLGPVKKYQRVFDSIDRPSHIYIHCGHTPQDLSSWCSTHLSHSSFIANDYTSFDQSQHGEAVVLEVLKMQRLSIPQHLINLHIHLKTNVSTQFGPLTCMRLTGEPGTYDDNSDYNLAVIYSQYSLVSSPILISGDDSVIAGSPPSNPHWPLVKDLLHLKFKTEVSSFPLFCGYYISSCGAVRNPLALFAKLMICVDDGTLPDKILSYLSEFSVGHLLGDSLLTTIPPHLHQFQSACHDFFCRNCSPSQKLLLSIEPIPESKLLRLILKVRWCSAAFFSLLPSKARDLLIAKSSIPSFHSDPRVSQLESELLPFFN
uniref:Replicase n=3 Tax=Ullucus tymovirus 2 TaxID=2491945 RepID=A0A3G8FWL4_9VIRU|nr:replicase [Ullucus tymovirus 2]